MRYRRSAAGAVAFTAVAGSWVLTAAGADARSLNVGCSSTVPAGTDTAPAEPCGR